MNIYESTSANINKAASIIRSGGIVSFPTETVYGLGADVFNPTGITRIFEAKNRPYFDPLIAHIASIHQLEQLTTGIDEKTEILARSFWPGPLTLVLPRSAAVPDIVTSGLPTVAIRMPDHPVALELIRRSETAVAAPSANPFGFLSPTTAEHVARYLGNRVNMILDGGECSVGVESTIIKLEDNKTYLLRPGGIPVEELEKIIGPIITAAEIHGRAEAPGQLPYHYSPSKPVRLCASSRDFDLENDSAAFLFFKDPPFLLPGKMNLEYIEILSPGGDLREAAARIFSALHRLDRLPVSVIYAESVPEIGLGRAIMDRLRKASQKMTHED